MLDEADIAFVSISHYISGMTLDVDGAGCGGAIVNLASSAG